MKRKLRKIVSVEIEKSNGRCYLHKIRPAVRYIVKLDCGHTVVRSGYDQGRKFLTKKFAACEWCETGEWII